ncbi:hypothetical protein TCE0_004f00393 [Talaromyces pinophilus]|uniref:Rhodopsin domain-containing protein n=1 Tax=Talaromyces pinophilus TaxID=128442 RepID=A0A0B8N2D9_TALPI|nr:hypothetical protein TCE0_004f00393 [Talaromyces pinophilus]
MPIPGVQITATNESPLILIATWLLLVLAAFAYIMRSIVKISRQAMRFELDDYLLAGALVFCAAQSIATIPRAANGFGKPSNTLSVDKINRTMKAAMAANILYVVSLDLSKLSLLLLLARLSPNKRHKRVMHGISIFVVLFTFISVFVASFSCSVPKTWNYTSGRCINRTVWWIVFDAYNVITEAALIFIPIYIIGQVRWPISRKVVFSTPFVLQICISTNADPYFAEWTVSVTTQIIQCSCLVCTCVLHLRNFLSSVETGFGLNGDLSASILLKPRATVGYSLSSESLIGSASMPGQIQVTTSYEVHAETVHGAKSGEEGGVL